MKIGKTNTTTITITTQSKDSIGIIFLVKIVLVIDLADIYTFKEKHCSIYIYYTLWCIKCLTRHSEFNRALILGPVSCGYMVKGRAHKDHIVVSFFLNTRRHLQLHTDLHLTLRERQLHSHYDLCYTKYAIMNVKKMFLKPRHIFGMELKWNEMSW